MKKILLGILLVLSSLHAEPTAIEKEITEIDVEIKRLQDRKKFLEAQLIANGAEEVLEQKQELKEEAVIEEKLFDLGLKTHTELGFIKTSGNTDTKTYNVDATIEKEIEKHIFKLSLLMIYGEEDSKENKNRLFTELNYYYKFSDRFAFNYSAAYKEDKFSGFENQIYTGPGVVYKLVDEEKHTMFIKGNALYSRDEIEDTRIDPSTGDQVDYPYPSGSIRQNDGYTDDYISYKLQALYTWNILKNLKFTEDFNYRSQLDEGENYFIYSKSALTSKLSDIFSFSLSYQVDYINEPADGKTTTDETTMFNLVIDY